MSFFHQVKDAFWQERTINSGALLKRPAIAHLSRCMVSVSWLQQNRSSCGVLQGQWRAIQGRNIRESVAGAMSDGVSLMHVEGDGWLECCDPNREASAAHIAEGGKVVLIGKVSEHTVHQRLTRLQPHSRMPDIWCLGWTGPAIYVDVYMYISLSTVGDHVHHFMQGAVHPVLHDLSSSSVLSGRPGCH